MPVVPSHRRFSVSTEGAALKLLLTPETRPLFPRKREREKRGEGNLQTSHSHSHLSICHSMPLLQCPASCEHPHPVVPSPSINSTPPPPFWSRGHGSARGTAKGDPVVSGAGSARSGQQRVKVLGGGCSGPDRDLGRSSRLFSWTWIWIWDWRWRWRRSTSSHLSPPCRPIAFRPRRQFRPRPHLFSQ